MWFAVIVAGLTIRTESLGVTSLVRALGLHQRFYNNLLDNFHSTGIKLDALTALWAQVVLKLFPGVLRVNGRLVLVGDGIKVAKQGKKMPAVKLLHQESESNTKAEYIMGHSFQAVSILTQAGKSVFAVPLAIRIHEGLVFSNRCKRTLLDKMISLLMIVAIDEPYYFVADAYYASGKVIKGLSEDNHLITRARSNAVAYQPFIQKSGKKSRGRPRTYGDKVLFKSLFNDLQAMTSASSPVYGEENVTLVYRVLSLSLFHRQFLKKIYGSCGEHSHIERPGGIALEDGVNPGKEQQGSQDEESAIRCGAMDWDDSRDSGRRLPAAIGFRN